MADCSHSSCKNRSICRSDYNHKWYMKDHARKKAYRLAYRKNNRAHLNAKSKEWYVKNRDRVLLKQKLQNIKDPQYQVKMRRQAKIECFNHYSNGKIKCNCCEIKDLIFLTLDHINNDGAKDRRTNGSGGNSIYFRLRKQGYPIGYQVLCFNCNHAKYLNGGMCPHKIEVLVS